MGVGAAGDQARAQTDQYWRDLLTAWGYIQSSRHVLWHSRQRLERSRALLDALVCSGS